MKVLLINTFQAPGATAGYYKRFLAPMPPITLAYLAAVLEKGGVEVAVYDDILNQGDTPSLEAAIRKERPDIVGLSVVTATYPRAEQVAASTRKVCPEAKIVMGNIHADTFYERILRAGTADFVVHGEGEITIVEMAHELAKASPSWEGIKGISYMADGELVRNEARPFMEDLDSLPFPAWHLFPIEQYKIFNFARVKDPGTLVLGSRGCPFRCTYCSLKNMSTTRRARSAKSIADEFEYLYDRFGYVQPSFIDPIYPFYKQEGYDFAAELIRRGLHKKIVWITETRTDLVDPPLLEALRESGLRRIMFGFESGDQVQLNAVRKGAKVDRGFAAMQAAKQAGVEVIGFFMLGIPGMREQSTALTVEYAKKLDVDFAKFTVFVPFPGTADYDSLLEAGEIIEPDNWDRYTSYPSRKVPPNYLPEGFDAEQIIKQQRWAHLSFYLRPRMMLRHLFKIRTLTFRDAFDGLATFFAPHWMLKQTREPGKSLPQST